MSPSPYNTYMHPGLPPGPITNPGDDAIKAALKPANGDWLWFVTTDDKGCHQVRRHGIRISQGGRRAEKERPDRVTERRTAVLDSRLKRSLPPVTERRPTRSSTHGSSAPFHR